MLTFTFNTNLKFVCHYALIRIKLVIVQKCEKNGAGYRIVCITCQVAGKVTEYEGETGRNGYTRGIEHLAAMRLEDDENALWKHCQIDHDGRIAEFSMTVLRSHRTPLVTQVDEAVRIVISRAECIMNSKSEWHQAPLVRIIPVSGLQEDQGAGRGSLQQGGERGGRRGGSRGRRGDRARRRFGTS